MKNEGKQGLGSCFFIGMKGVHDMHVPMIELSDVSMVYPTGSRALSNISLTIEKGEFIFVAGGSGSGKTTLIRLLMREMLPTSGKIVVNRRDLCVMKRRNFPAYRREIGVVFQDFKLLTDRNIYDNVSIAKMVAGAGPAEIKKQVPLILDTVGLSSKMKSFPNELSGGEQQRAAIARALANKPPLLLADEPTGNLDPVISWEIMKLLEEINKNGTTVLMVTHNKEIVDKMKKRVITLKDGEILKDEKKGSYYYGRELAETAVHAEADGE